MFRWRGLPPGKDQMNKVILIGNITKDLELKKTQTGKSVLEFSIATNDGNKVAKFHDCKAWEKTAELIAQYCKKGSKICVEGKAWYDEFEKDGRKLKSKYILVNTVEFLDRPTESVGAKRTIEARPKWNYQETLTGDGKDATGFKVSPDDLPFF